MRWLVSWRTQLTPRPTVVCLPEAGAGCGQYREWQAVTPDISIIGVQLPGREQRWADPPVLHIDEAVSETVAELLHTIDRSVPLVIFGQSFGALLAYEIAVRLSTQAGRSVAGLVVAASKPPRDWSKAGGELAADESQLNRLIAARRLDDKDLDEDSRQLMLEVLRRDARLAATYKTHFGHKVSCPLESWGGLDDKIVSATDLDRWRRYTSGRFTRRSFPGDHGFCRATSNSVPSLLQSIVRP